MQWEMHISIFEEEFLQDRRMCQYSRNNSIQSSFWTMILLSWFPNFHILWVWTQEADPGYPCVRGKSDRVIQFVCPGLNVNESHFAHVKVTKIFLVPRQGPRLLLIIILPESKTFHVQFLNDFQFLSRWGELTQKATKMFRCCYFHWNIIYLPHERI